MRLNESLPFTDEGFEFVRGEGHAGEVCETVFTLDFVDAELDFTKGVFFVVLEVCEGDFENSAFESVIGGFFIVSIDGRRCTEGMYLDR